MDLNQKRFKIEDYAKIYELIGGDDGGIKKEVLKKNIEEVLKLLNIDENEEKLGQIAEEQAKEVIELLASNENSLSTEDFINIMTSNTPIPENIEEIL